MVQCSGLLSLKHRCANLSKIMCFFSNNFMIVNDFFTIFMILLTFNYYILLEYKNVKYNKKTLIEDKLICKYEQTFQILFCITSDVVLKLIDHLSFFIDDKKLVFLCKHQNLI